MYKVLIVEDEMLVRLGLKNSINWSKFNMTVVNDVSNGQEALDAYLKDAPNIIITDLRMPVMDGMELISKVREKDKKTKIIILTCMEEFNLARKALSMGVSDYILKLTMTQNDIDAVLKKVQDSLDEQNKHESSVKGLDHDVGTFREKLIKDYIFYDLYSKEEFTKYVYDLKLKIRPDRIILSIMEIDHYKQLQDRFADEQGQLISFSMLNVLNELLEGYKRGEAFHEKDGRYLIIFSFYDILQNAEIHDELSTILEHIRRVLKTYFNVSVTFASSRDFNGYELIKKNYKECSYLLKYKFYTNIGSSLFCETIKYDKVTLEVRSLLQKYLDDCALLNEPYRKLLQTHIDSLVCTNPSESNGLKKWFFQWIHFVISFCNLTGESTASLVSNYEDEIRECESLEEVISVSRIYNRKVLELKNTRKSFSKEVAAAIRFINENYIMEISLLQVADHVQLSPNYLSSLFKKELDMSFIEYLNEVRIEKAKELLLNTFMKSYEVAEKVGFTDNSYFGRTFKKVVGVSPNEFRKQWITE
jgi:Response regulator containing CheY-like receiver domain and AraC-type DNA-binding domain